MTAEYPETRGEESQQRHGYYDTTQPWLDGYRVIARQCDGRRRGGHVPLAR